MACAVTRNVLSDRNRSCRPVCCQFSQVFTRVNARMFAQGAGAIRCRSYRHLACVMHGCRYPGHWAVG